ncbi:uncharacterized protein LOC132740910 isoform X2 [Ruditapes philippinarum]|uniref:uncharacterized protein LOC132740910 isoform X2 n=1 Tax=Ruditapes philippinarum TaxID=129788 RepID=UPI00295AA700|nr:uncharacterized protein LOC132740910 isoform X2 [Ruditapes philippinarum]
MNYFCCQSLILNIYMDLPKASVAVLSSLGKICLQELFDCVNRTVPNCVDSMKDKYITFRYTPWDCHLLEDASTEIGNKCGNDVIFEVRIKESTDNIIIFQTDVNNYIEKSANSCRISYGAAMIYLMLMVKCVLLWCNQ